MMHMYPLVLLLSTIVTITSASDVLELTDDNFQDGVKGKDIILIEFFAPWCGHCKKLAPEYDTAATKLLKNDPPIPIAKVDCVGEGKASCQKYGVSGYPTLKIFRAGEFSQEYDGPRDASGIVSYMKKNAGPSSVEITDPQHFEKKVDKAEDILVVGFFSSASDRLNKNFMKAADQNRNDFAFAHTIDEAVMEKAGHKDVVVLYRPKHLHAKFDEPAVILTDGTANVNDIVTFIKANEHGLVGQIKPDNDDSFKRPLIVAHYQVDWKKNPKGSRYWRNRVARVAKKFTQFTFAIAAKSDYSGKVSEWGWKDDDSVNVVAYCEKKKTYKMTAPFSVEALEQFATDFHAHKLEPYIKSEDVPEDNSGPVKVVVGKNFDEIVNDETKDVLIEFYAPWCGHCKKLAPIYDELGEKLKDNTDIVIAKMDATLNDPPPNFAVSGFPTLYWAPMGGKENPKKYQGGREVDDFIDYIKKHSTNPVHLGDKKKGKKKKKKSKEEL